jgi:hypothetical protein
MAAEADVDQPSQSASVSAAPDTANTGSSAGPAAEAPAPAEALEAGEGTGSTGVSVANPAQNSVDTPIPTATATETAIPTSTPSPTATEIPATATPIPTPTATPLPAGWVFSGVQVSPRQSGGSPLLYGDVINNTGSPQELFLITGDFYNDQGQAIPNVFTVDYWPIDTIPQGGRVPFELTVVGLQSVANFELSVEAASSEETPNQNFEFLDVNQSSEDGGYCLSGRLQNLGSELKYYVSIATVLFDDQNNVINFSDHYIHSPTNLVTGQTTDFKVCAESFSQNVARHELRAWGL